MVRSEEERNMAIDVINKVSISNSNVHLTAEQVLSIIEYIEDIFGEKVMVDIATDDNDPYNPVFCYKKGLVEDYGLESGFRKYNMIFGVRNVEENNE